jgi:hypothetical protein
MGFAKLESLHVDYFNDCSYDPSTLINQAITPLLQHRSECPYGGKLAPSVDTELLIDQGIIQRIQINMRKRLGETRRIDQNMQALALADILGSQ